MPRSIECRLAALSALIATSLIVLTNPAAAQQPSTAQRDAIRSACRSDYETYCASVPPGGKPSLMCLQKNMTSLSAPCQKAVGAVGKASSAPTAAPPASSAAAPPAAASPPAQAATGASPAPASPPPAGAATQATVGAAPMAPPPRALTPRREFMLVRSVLQRRLPHVLQQRRLWWWSGRSMPTRKPGVTVSNLSKRTDGIALPLNFYC